MFDYSIFDIFNVEEFIDEMDAKAFLLFQIALVVGVSLKDFSTTIKMVSNANQLVDPIVGIWDVIRTLRTTLALY
jgi:hypothetical protein